MELNRLMFREYDIRGIWNEDITEEISYHIGRAYATKLLSFGKNKMIVGYDNRLSSPIIEENLVKGLTEGGVNVVRLGLVTTPMYYYAWDKLNIHAGIMITASHNPKEYNGFKMSYNGIHNMFGKDVSDLYYVIINGIYSEGNGMIEYADIKEDYVNMIHNHIDMGNNKLKVVYDCGNGTTSIIADKIFASLPQIEAIPIFNISDGNFPNHHPDPCIYENLLSLKDRVLKEHADLGVGYDGDGDRVGFIDNLGNMLEIDKFMIVMWKYLYDKVSNKACLFDVKCTKALEDELIRLGVKPIEYRTGNSYTRAASAEGDYPLSGELSGHVYFRDKFPGYDDGIYAGMRLIELLSHTSAPLSSMLDDVNKYYSTPEIKIPVPDELKFSIVEKIKEYSLSKGYKTLTIDGSKSKFSDGFALVRASNTGPNITMRFEATTKERLEEIKEEFTKELNKYLDK